MLNIELENRFLPVYPLLKLCMISSLMMLFIGCSPQNENEQTNLSGLDVVEVEMMKLPNAALFESDRTSSYVGFKVSHLQLHAIRGNFERYHAAVLYNPEKPDKISVTFRINVNSITTGVSMRDRDLNSDRYFDQAAYPYIFFTSQEIKTNKEGGYIATGALTAKGVTKNIEVSFHITTPEVIAIPGRKDYVINLEGSARINRKDFGIGRSGGRSGIIADEVDLEFTLLLRQQNYDVIDFNNNPKLSIAEKMYGIINNGEGVEKAMIAYSSLKESKPEEYQTNQFDLEILARKLMHHKKYQEALKVLELMIEQDPSYIRSYLKSAEVHGLLDNRSQCLDFLQKAKLLDTTHPVALEMLRYFDTI